MRILYIVILFNAHVHGELIREEHIARESSDILEYTHKHARAHSQPASQPATHLLREVRVHGTCGFRVFLAVEYSQNSV
jgi:hypothetical protein